MDALWMTVKNYRKQLLLAALVAIALLLTADQMTLERFEPPYKGELTLAEFAENYNQQAGLLGQGCGSLDENGQLRSDELMLIMRKREAPYYWENVSFSYEMDGEYVTAVTITGHLAVCPPQYWNGQGRPKNLPATCAAVAALAWAQEDAPPLQLLRQARLGFLKNRGLTDYDTKITGVNIANRAAPTEGMGEYDMTFTIRLAE